MTAAARTRWGYPSRSGPGTAGSPGLYTPGGFENTEKKIPCSNDPFPRCMAARPWANSEKNKGISSCTIFPVRAPATEPEVCSRRNRAVAHDSVAGAGPC